MAALAEIVCSTLLMATGWATFFTTTVVGAAGAMLGLLTWNQLRSDHALLNGRLCGWTSMTTLWVLVRGHAVLVALELAACGYSAYTIAIPTGGRHFLLASLTSAAGMTLSAVVVVAALWLVIELPHVIESVYAAAALSTVRRMCVRSTASFDERGSIRSRPGEAFSPGVVVSSTFDLRNDDGGPEVLSDDGGDGAASAHGSALRHPLPQRTNALAMLPQVQRSSAAYERSSLASPHLHLDPQGSVNGDAAAEETASLLDDLVGDDPVFRKT